MTGYEVLTLCISVISAAIAITSLIRTRVIAEEQLRLEKITAELAKKQIAQIDKAEFEQNLPKLRVDLVKLGRDYNFLIANRGQGSAFNLNFELVDCSKSPLVADEVSDKFPCRELRSDSRIKLLACITNMSPNCYEARLTWSDSDGNSHSEDFPVSL